MNRKQHLEWCKQRALKHCDDNQMFLAAWIAFKSDMSKHEETKDHIALALGDELIAFPALRMMMEGADEATLKSTFNEETRRFIEGFN